jgi:hypothetical protein
VETIHLWIPFGSIRYEKSSRNLTESRKFNENFREQQDTRYKLRARLRGPVPFLNRFWEIEGLNARNKWTFSLRTYNVVPAESMVIQYAFDGNVKGVQDFFKKGKASPYDTYREMTLLHVRRRTHVTSNANFI